MCQFNLNFFLAHIFHLLISKNERSDKFWNYRFSTESISVRPLIRQTFVRTFFLIGEDFYECSSTKLKKFEDLIEFKRLNRLSLN